MSVEVKPWITITVAGATAGVMVSAFAYSATYHVGSAAATTTGFMVDAAGAWLGCQGAFWRCGERRRKSDE